MPEPLKHCAHKAESLLRPKCDFCCKDAEYDSRAHIWGGSWAYMCEDHFKQYGVGLALSIRQGSKADLEGGTRWQKSGKS